MEEIKAYSLFEFNEYIRRIIALNVPDPIWISAEIGQLSFSRGHYYLSLIQKAEEAETILAEIDAVIWQSTFRKLKRKIGLSFQQLLKEGTEVLVKAKPDFHERYGLKLTIEDIDPSYTLGKLELKRQQILEELKQLGLLNLNNKLQFPIAFQNLAILSSPQAAGLQDFMQQLEENPYGYQFNASLFPIVVQGEQVEKELLAALKRIQNGSINFDAVLLIRGGGSKLDLAAFDNLAMGKAIAQFPIPFLSGIGHDINQTIVDQVAHTALKTPTAVADFLINHNLQFEFRLNQWALGLKNHTATQLQGANFKVFDLEKQLQFFSKALIDNQKRNLDYIQKEIPKLGKFQLKLAHQSIRELEGLQRILSPEATLQRGYTITLKNKEILHSSKQIKKGERFTTLFKDGAIKSDVIDEV